MPNQYQSAWKKVQDWLQADTVSIIQALVLSYLINLSEALASRTVVVHRCALKLPLSEAFDINFEHPHFSLVARSHFWQNPPHTTVISTWSLEEVVKNLTNWVIKKGNVKELFLKTLFVLAVASSNRSAELAAVAREDISLRGSSMVLPLRYNL